MKVLILAAGYGTRLKVLGEGTPKALLEINGKPLVNYILDRIANLNGLNEVILVTNDKFTSIFEEWVVQQNKFVHKISVVNDGTKTSDDRLGSIGDINFVLKQKAIHDDLLVIGGDNLFDYNIDEYIHFSQSHTDYVSIGLYDIGSLAEATKFGVVSLNAEKKVESFEEKPEHPKSSLIAMCFYYLPQKTLGLVDDYLNDSGKSDHAGDYIRWLHHRSEVYGFKFSGKWYDIGSLESYEEAKEKFK